MKKEYINPEMQVVMMQTNSTILAGSGDGTGFGQGYMNGSQGDASQFYDNGDSNESW